jgi:hypothetical protein
MALHVEADRFFGPRRPPSSIIPQIFRDQSGRSAAFRRILRIITLNWAMLEVMQYLRANGYKTYIVTGGGQDFVRVYAEKVYGIPPEQVVGTAGGTKYGYDKSGKPILTKEPKLLLNDDKAGKPEGIHLIIGRRPYAAFGNSVGDRQMLEYTGAGDGARLMMLVLHDDGKREYAYGPAQGLPNTKVGTFNQALYDEAKKKGWVIISMKNDWTKIFA